MAMSIRTLAYGTNGYLLEKDGFRILIDCPSDCEPGVVAEAAPQAVLHTHVQAEHCGEWQWIPDTPVYVPEGGNELARLSDRYLSDCRTLWAEDRDWSDLGEEPYGIAGCTTARPTPVPLGVAGLLKPGTVFRYGPIALEVIALPGHGKESVGLYIREEGLLFAGDLLQQGGTLPNLYDLERSYGGPGGYPDLRASLERVLGLGPSAILPAHGPALTNPAEDIGLLASNLEWLAHPPTVRDDRPPAQTDKAPLRILGHYREMVPGLFQALLSGNTIIFIDDSGEGLVIDPGPCLWGTWEEDCRGFREGLLELETVAGLKAVTAILATHPHGDHVQMAEVLREMYGAPIIATPDIARLLGNPEGYGYPCRLDWYNFPVKAITVDSVVGYGEPIRWAGIEVTPYRTPGHCWAHAAYSLEWKGMSVLCTGDALMYGDGPFHVPLPIIYNDTAWPERGFGATLDVLERLSPDILAGGHGHFNTVGPSLIPDIRRAYSMSLARVSAMVGPSNLQKAMTPPGYDSKHGILERFGRIFQS